MTKKWVKRLAIALGSLLGIILLANLGINLWIKYQLPNYLKNNSDYAIQYDKLEINLGTGNVFSTQFAIQNKNPENAAIMGIKGTVDTIKINSFGILDFIWHKEISISDAELSNPKITILLPENKEKPKQKKQSKPFTMEHLQIKNGEIEVFKNKDTKIFSAKKLNFLVNGFLLNEDTKNEELPFEWEEFAINGKEVFFKNNSYQVDANQLVLENNVGKLKDLKLLPLTHHKKGESIETTLKSLEFQLNSWEIYNKKIKVDCENLKIDSLNTKIITQNKNHPKKEAKKQNNLDILIRKGEIINSDLSFQKDNLPLVVNGINAHFSGIKVDNSSGEKLSTKVENYQLKANKIAYTTVFYQMNASDFSFSPKEISTHHFKMKPRYSRAEFIRKIKTEKDLFDVDFQSLKMNGEWDLFSDKKIIQGQNLQISGMKANIFRSKLPPDDRTRKPMYSELLRGIKIPLYIQKINILQSHLEYEEDTYKSNGAGKLTFADFNMNVKNMNSAKIKGKPTQIPIEIDCKFFGTSPMKVSWLLDTKSADDKFSISGSIHQLSASRINQFVEPYLNLRTMGKIENIQFDFNGNKNGIVGDFKMKHKDLKVSLLNSKGKKKKFLSALVNMVIKTDSKKYPEYVKVEKIPRDPTKSFFNMFWKGVESGLVRTLVGNNVEEARQDLKSK